jgi:hypothetical protein
MHGPQRQRSQRRLGAAGSPGRSTPHQRSVTRTPTYGRARRVFVELRLDHRPSSTACRPDRTASHRVPRMRRLGSLG